MKTMIICFGKLVQRSKMCGIDATLRVTSRPEFSNGFWIIFRGIFYRKLRPLRKFAVRWRCTMPKFINICRTMKTYDRTLVRQKKTMREVKAGHGYLPSINSLRKISRKSGFKKVGSSLNFCWWAPQALKPPPIDVTNFWSKNSNMTSLFQNDKVLINYS